MSVLRVLLLFIGFSLSISAQSNSWIGQSGQWNDAANWSDGVVPTNSEAVTIDAENFSITIPSGYTAFAEHINIMPGTTLEIASEAILNLTHLTSVEGINNAGSIIILGNLNITGYPDAAFKNIGTIGNPAGFNNAGNLSIADSGIGLIFRSSTIATNSGSILIENISGINTNGLINQSDSEFENKLEATIEIKDINGTDSEGFLNESTFTNFGKLTIDDIETTIGLFNNSAAAVCENNDTFVIKNVIGAGVKNELGLIKGDGYWDVGQLRNEGNLAPGTSPGSIKIIGDLNTNAAEANTIMEVYGAGGAGAADGHDFIDLTGSLTLGGDLEIKVPNDFIADLTARYELFSYGFLLINTFTGVVLPPALIDFEIDYTSTAGSIFLVGPLAPLPVELIDFNATQIARNIELNWSTAEEINNKGFEIQRSRFSNNWETLKFEESKNATTQSGILTNYQFTDINPFCDQNYYRLKQIDLDGTASFTDILLVKYNCKNEKESLLLYPNPCSDHFMLNTQGPEQLRLYDHSGKLIKSLDYPGRNINIKDLPSGNYTVELIFDQIIHVRKLIKRD